MSAKNIFCSLFTIAAIAGTLHGAPKPRDPAASKETFTEISKQLDLGGDLFIVANVEGLLEGYIETIQGFVSAMPVQPGSEEEKNVKKMEAAAAFLERSGLYAIKGLGYSVVPREDGNNNVAFFLSRQPQAAALPLWRGIVGAAPIKMKCLEYLPAETVIARAGTTDLSSIWTLVKEAITEIGDEESKTQFNMGLSIAEQQLGVSIDDLIQSLEAESVVSLQLARGVTSTIPLGMQATEIPQPSLLLLTKVKNDLIIETIQRMATQMMGQELPKSTIGEATVYTLQIPMPLPIPINITFARHGEYLLIGSNADVVTKALAASKDRSGLLADADFQMALPDAMEPNNGILYVSERFSKSVADLQMRMMQMAPTPDSEEAELFEFIKKMQQERGDFACAFTTKNYRSGIKTSGWSTAGGQEIFASATMAPIGLMGAIAIPSFVKARTTAQQNACINNLRQLDAAKEQWAMANNKANGDIPVEPEVLEYIRGSTMPVCPKGGTYSLNPIGEAPTCTILGHELPY